MNTQTALFLATLVALALAFFWPHLGFLARWRQARQLAERALVEDALKHIHARERRGTLATPESLAGKLNRSVKGALELIASLEEGGLVQSTGAGLVLTDAGRELALRVIRAHRLLERYLADELRMPLEEIHAAADRREHRVTPEEVDELEVRLGYPQTDPHGDPIPTSGGALEELPGTALSDWEVGTPAKIVHLEDEPVELMAQMVAAGLAPGMHIEVRRVSRDQLVLWDGERERVLAPVVASAVQVAEVPHPVQPPAKLSSLRPGEFARVIALRSEGFQRRRLLDLGLTPGTVVKCAFPGPAGEPMAYVVRGATIALRREQGDQIEIEPLTSAEQESRSP
ncbi:MAG TPA: iron dependent repressor, metal binding and dimerization domain protein [Gemmatimonadota bacterium]|nr:iron dependent repressor, metal binding and dimerization domain protein [Gemmatimonadota bacterium]